MNKNDLRQKLRERDGTKCHYCGIEEKDFIPVWGKFYKTRGCQLEVDHKDNDRENNNLDNLVLACALCNCAKSNKLTHDEFKKVGDVIRDIWHHHLR